MFPGFFIIFAAEKIFETMSFENISAEAILFFILYGITGVVSLIAAVYLLLRRGITAREASRLLKRHKRETKCTEIVPSLFLGYKGTNFPRNNQKFVGEYNLIAKN